MKHYKTYKGYKLYTPSTCKKRIYVEGPNALGTSYFYKVEKAHEYIDFLVKYLGNTNEQ